MRSSLLFWVLSGSLFVVACSGSGTNGTGIGASGGVGGAAASSNGGKGASSNGGTSASSNGGAKGTGGAATGGANASGGTGNAGTGGAGGGSACGKAVCGPTSCGTIMDACGALIDCGTCKTGVCGATKPNVCSACTGSCPTGANCGVVSDGCGGLLDCSGGHTCASNEICKDNVCVVGQQGGCTGFCKQQSTKCPDTTAVSGTVYAPNGVLPLPNAIVYVPNGSTTTPYGVTPFVDGVAGGACTCDISGDPLISATSGTDGTFTLKNVPVGSNIPLVIQLGRWRRMITISTVTECQTTQIPANLTNLPTRQNMGNNGGIDAIPLMALSTGGVDALECVLRKMGVEDSQFSNAGGTGRVRFYRDNGARCTNGGGACTGRTPGYAQLTSTQANVDQYDALLFPCDGGAHDINAADKNRVLDVATNTSAYVNKGGRAFFTHFSYAWLYNQQPSINLPWRSTTNSAAVDNPSRTTHHDGAENVAIDTTFSRGQVFASWLGLAQVGALSVVNPPEISVLESRWNLNNSATWNNAGPAQRWAYYANDDPDAAIMHVTFDTPWGLPAAQQCGRVLFSDFHVTTAALAGAACTNNGQSTTNCNFPEECSTTFTAQEKVLAYMMFDMTSCVQPPKLSCNKKTCADYPNSCGPQSDGCGGFISCPACPPCVPQTCEKACPDGSCSSKYQSPTPAYNVDCAQSTGCSNPPTMQCWCQPG